MSFFGKAKQWLNIGGVKVELDVPPQIERYAGQINGMVKLTTKSEQQIKDLHFEIEEEWTRGRDEERETKKFILGKAVVHGGFTIKPGEEKFLEFNLPFSVEDSRNDFLKAHGGVYGAIGTAGAWVDGESSRFTVSVLADVDKTGFDPSDQKEIQLV